ncbi:polysaccharide lyase family 7 protein [Bacteroidota bacterium]
MLLAISAFLNAQDYQIIFAILGNTNSPDSILVENSSRALQVVLQNGDVLHLEEATGISMSTNNMHPLKVYPNPMADIATVEFYSSAQGKVDIQVYTMDGKRILSSNQNLPQGYNSYAISGLNEGINLVHLNSLESKWTALIISNASTIVTPGIDWISTEQNNLSDSQLKSAANSQAIVNMPYGEGESLKLTAYLSEYTSIEELVATGDTTIDFTFIPYTAFSADKTTTTVDNAITFTDNSVNNATSWSWTFGDGGSSTEQNPIHTYTTAGSYTVSLRASNAAGDSTTSKPDYITIEIQAASDYPSDVISYFDEWKITMGDGSGENDLVDYEHSDYFYDTNDGTSNWVVYKTPNSGGTTPNSSNTRSELRQISEWTPETGGKLTGALKVMHVSTTADARVPASFSVVVGQIHSSEGHENEPLKIFYKKFPGHTKGSVFWHYEINTDGDDNGERWDYSTAIWGNDWSVVGSTADTYPAEPTEGIELGEEFSYEINVYQGIMYLTFTSAGHDTVTFTKSLIESEYTMYEDIPQQVLDVFSSTGQDGTERSSAYSGELQYFKQGAYNQTNGKDPADNMVWNTGAETYGGDLEDQYANGSYTEVRFKTASVGSGTAPYNK